MVTYVTINIMDWHVYSCSVDDPIKCTTILVIQCQKTNNVESGYLVMQWWKKRLLKRLQTETGEYLTGEALVDAVSKMRTEMWEAGRSEGYQDGYQEAEEEQCRAFSAALALTLHEDYGFTKEQIIEFQNACNRHTALLNDDLIQQVLDEWLTEVHYIDNKHIDDKQGQKE